MRRFSWAVAFGTLVTSAASAAPLPFDGSWEEQGLLRWRTNEYVQNGTSLAVKSDSTVSILYKVLDPAARGAESASWSWRVDEGVPPTDLTVKGGDDRNLALYFLFADPDVTAELEGVSLRRVMTNPNVRILIYVWGGQHEIGDVLPSPYLDERGVTVILQPSKTGDAEETVDFADDLQKAFGERPQQLLGVAVSADADDTETRIEGEISDLTLR